MPKLKLPRALLLAAVAVFFSGCGENTSLTPSGKVVDTGPQIDPTTGEPAHADLSHAHEHPDPEALKSAPEWQQPLMPAFEQAAAAYNVPLDLLLVLGKLGSGLENRGDVPTIEGGYGVMGLRDNDLTGDSLVLAADLLDVDTDALIRDPVLSILGAAAVLDLYATRTAVDKDGGIEAWLPAVVMYAGLDEEDSKFFAVSVYELLQVGFDYTNHFGETFSVAPRELAGIDLNALVPPGVTRLSLEQLEAESLAIESGLKQLPFGDNPLQVAAKPDYPGAIWDPAASCNYSTSVTNKDTIVIHTIEGSAAGARSWFKNCQSSVSAHYVISEAGGVWQMVEERHVAWTQGCYNSRSVGFEHEGYASQSSHPTALYNASALVARNVCDRRGIPKQKRTTGPGIIGHRDVTNCCCGTHTDPGNGWNWTYYINQVVGSPPPPTWAATYRAQSYPSTMEVNSTAIVWAEFNNTGTGTWLHGQTFLGTQGPQDRSSPFCNLPNWHSCNRPTEVDQSSVGNGQVGRFTFILKAPSTPGQYVEKFKLVREGVTWFGPEITWTINVVPPPTPPPTITAHPSAVTICPGANATFSVTASGSGLSYQWQRNGSNISNGGKFSGATSATLTITGAASGEAGNYRCVVSNAGGSATSNQAALTVKPATTITAHPAAQAVCQGGTANFSVTATGDGTVTYQWQKDGTNISGATNSTLQITNVTSANVGNYRCVVTAGCGAATSNNAALSINPPTAITAHPQNKTVAAFASASFSATATGANLTYQWQKNGVNISNGGNISGATSATLTINPASPSDQANYRCVVTGACGTVNSNEATLTVQAIMADAFDAYANQAAFEAVWADTGNSAYLLDNAFGNPGKSIVMPSPSANFLGRYARHIGGKYTGSDSTPLIVSLDFWLDPAGGPTWSGARHFLEFRGYAGTTFAGGSLENLVAIGVNNNSDDTFDSTRYQGRVVNGANWATLDEGSAGGRQGGWHNLKIEIGATFVKFYVDGVLGETESRPNSFGFDWVVLGSDLTANGHVAAIDNVSVSGGIPLPTFTQHPEPATVCEGGNASFTAAASGSGTLTYRWALNGSDLSDGTGISGANTPTLSLTGVDAGKAGLYTCRVTNADGSVTSNAAELVFHPAVTITQHPAAQSVCVGGNATFTVAASGPAPLSYQWQKDGTNISGATSATLQITGAGSGSVGSYRCVVTDGCSNTATSNSAALTLNGAPTIGGSNPAVLIVAKNSTCGTANQLTLSASDPDTPGGSLTWSIEVAPTHGDAGIVGSSTGASVTVCYVPDLDQLNPDSFVVRVTDACGNYDEVVVETSVDPCPNLLTESFGGYANQAAFEAVWTDTGNSEYYLDTTNGWLTMPSPSANSLGKYYRNLGGDFDGTDANPLVLTFDFYLDPAGAPGWSGARHYVELRGYSGDEYNSGSLENLLAIGVNNNSSDTFSTLKYQGRVLNGAAWQTLDEGSAPNRAGGWHQLKIEVTTSQVRFYVDGILSETEARPNSLGFDCVVIGSDLTSAGFLAAVDNLQVTCGP